MFWFSDWEWMGGGRRGDWKGKGDGVVCMNSF